MPQIYFGSLDFEHTSKILTQSWTWIKPSKYKNKQKWTPKDTHHDTSIFIDLVQNDLNEGKKKNNPKPNLSKGVMGKQWKNLLKERILLLSL